MRKAGEAIVGMLHLEWIKSEDVIQWFLAFYNEKLLIKQTKYKCIEYRKNVWKKVTFLYVYSLDVKISCLVLSLLGRYLQKTANLSGITQKKTSGMFETWREQAGLGGPNGQHCCYRSWVLFFSRCFRLGTIDLVTPKHWKYIPKMSPLEAWFFPSNETRRGNFIMENF